MNTRQRTLLIRAIDAGGMLQLTGHEVRSAQVLADRGLGVVTRTAWINGHPRQCPPRLVIYRDIMALAAALRKPA